jgi:hypothetical protein
MAGKHYRGWYIHIIDERLKSQGRARDLVHFHQNGLHTLSAYAL